MAAHHVRTYHTSSQVVMTSSSSSFSFPSLLLFPSLSLPSLPFCSLLLSLLFSSASLLRFLSLFPFFSFSHSVPLLFSLLVSRLLPSLSLRLTSPAFFPSLFPSLSICFSSLLFSSYNIQNIITAVLERLKTANNSAVLMDALAELYTFDKQFDKTLHMYPSIPSIDHPTPHPYIHHISSLSSVSVFVV